MRRADTESPQPRAETAEPRLREITPACARKRPARRYASYPAGNHPRVHGEECRARSSLTLIQESPPRARGRADEGKPSGEKIGITPACAGKRTPSCLVNTVIAESPPRARGRSRWGKRGRSLKGITPACAGKSPLHSRSRSVSRNHPRVRGEESNENAASEDMAIPPKSGFFALFQEPPPSAARFQSAGPGAFRLSSIVPVLFVMRPNRPRPPVRAGIPQATTHCP